MNEIIKKLIEKNFIAYKKSGNVYLYPLLSSYKLTKEEIEEIKKEGLFNDLYADKTCGEGNTI